MIESTTQKIEALGIQLKFHKYVPQTTTPADKKDLFKLSKNKIKLTVDELKENLKEIIRKAPHLQVEHLADLETDEIRLTNSVLLPKEKREELYRARVTVLKERLEEARKKRKEKSTVLRVQY